MTNVDEQWPERPVELELIAEYQRRLHSTPDGVWRNVLDFEHLPWVHGHAFAAVERLAGGRDWWRARVTLAPASFGQTMVLELRVDRERLRYVTRTLEGRSMGAYILTRLEPFDAAHTDIHVEFWGPPESPMRTRLKAKSYLALYERLWDEDEQMIETMLAADEQQPWRGEPGQRLRVLAHDRVDDGQRTLGLAQTGDQLWVHDPVCPHMGGPLLGALVDEQGRLRCPWHDYRFALADGRCDRAPGLRLRCRPARRVDPDHVET